MGGKIPDNSPEWLPIVRPCYQAAALVFTALQTLGDYPADSPDYDPVAVDHLRKALQRLAPGLGNMEILGAPHPAKTGYLDRVAAGLCPECGKPLGVGPQERHLLPRVDRGSGWEFIAPCGHVALGIKKGSQVAKSYGLTDEAAPIASQRPARDDETQEAPVATSSEGSAMRRFRAIGAAPARLIREG